MTTALLQNIMLSYYQNHETHVSNDTDPAMGNENAIHQQLLAEASRDPANPGDDASHGSQSEDPSDPESTCPPVGFSPRFVSQC